MEAAAKGAGMVTNTSATLEGRLGTTGDGTGDYWFEYGPTTDYGQSTGDRLFMEHNLAVLCPDPASAGGFDVGPGTFTVEGG